MELRVLGPLEVLGSQGAVPISQPKLRVLLAALIVQRGKARDTDSLVDDLWGETPPPSAAKLLQVYVSQLRKALPREIAIRTTSAGYLLEVADEAVDAWRFEQLVSEARRAGRARNLPLASSGLRRALGLWRGPALADVRYAELAQPEIARLEALREAATEELLEADLGLGRDVEVLARARALLAQDPTRERVAALAMLAAYRSLGAGEALAIANRLRDELRADLDAEPVAELVELRRRIERRDPELALQPATELMPESTLPSPPTQLLGRGRELRELRTLLERPTLRFLSLTGAGGSGKSRLALELARESAADYANGAVWVELASLTSPTLVLPTIARAIDLDPGADAFSTLVGALKEREVLLVLDNLEHLRDAAPDLVRLLAAVPRLRLVTTSRVVLHVSGEHVYSVAPLPADAAVALFAERAAASDPAWNRGGEDEHTIAEICRQLDHLPLAIELAAGRVRALGLRGVFERLPSRLTLLSAGPRDLPARQQTLRETLAWSVNLLDPQAAAVLARLAVFPAGCSIESASAVAGADDRTLTELVDHHLIQPVEVDGERRYRLLETVREHAWERLGSGRSEAETALVRWARVFVRDADLNAVSPIAPTTLDRVEREIDAMREALRHASRDPDPAAELELAAGLWRLWLIRGYVAEGFAIMEDLLARRGRVATRDGARAVRAAGSLAWTMDLGERARILATDALDLSLEVGDASEEVAALALVGTVAQSAGDHSEARKRLAAAVRRAEATGQPERAAAASLNLGVSYLAVREFDAARRTFEDVVARGYHRGPEGSGLIQINLGEAELGAGNLVAAEAHYLAAAQAFAELGFHARHANALQGLAAVEVRTDRAGDAARHLGVAAGLLAATGWGTDGSSPQGMAESAARASLGDTEFERIFEAARAEAAQHRSAPGRAS